MECKVGYTANFRAKYERFITQRAKQAPTFSLSAKVGYFESKSKIWVIYKAKCKILDSADTKCKIGDAENIRRKQRRFMTLRGKQGITQLPSAKKMMLLT